jgi:hypothetical protein
MTINHLSAAEAEAHFTNGHDLEQWLDVREEADITVIRWLGIEHSRDELVTLRHCEVIDDGNENVIDIYEFTPWEADCDFGKESIFSSFGDACRYAVAEYGAKADGFVARGVIQWEYKDWKTHSQIGRKPIPRL